MSFKNIRQQENNKLREEIKKLRGALKDIKDDILIEAPLLSKKGENSPQTLISTDKYFDKLQSLQSDEMEKLCKFENFRDEKVDDFLESSLKFSFDSSKAKDNSISLEERMMNSSSNFNNTSEAFPKFFSPERHSHNKNPALDEDQPLPTFFPANTSEQSPQNIKNSFEPLNEPSESSVQSENKSVDQKNLLVEIEALRKENMMLRLQLQASKSVKKTSPKAKVASVPFTCKSITELPKSVSNSSKSPKATTPKAITSKATTPKATTPMYSIPDNIRPTRRRLNSASRSKSKSLTPRDLSVKSNKSQSTPKRNRHCNICDHLLSKGYSTKYCSKHGSVLTINQ